MRLVSYRLAERLVKIINNVGDVFDTHRQSHEAGADARLGQLLLGELGVGGGSGVDDQRLRVTDVGQVAGEVHRFDQLLAGGAAALDTEAEHRAGTGRQVL